MVKRQGQSVGGHAMSFSFMMQDPTSIQSTRHIPLIRNLQKQVKDTDAQLKETKKVLQSVVKTFLESNNKIVAEAVAGAKKKTGPKMVEAEVQSSPTVLGRLPKLTKLPSLMIADGKDLPRPEKRKRRK
ncbi:unnamed protein product, partial [Prorocentrum cordatum]